NPSQPAILGVPPVPQLSLNETTSTGSGLLVATTANIAPNPHQVALFDNSVPSDVTKFLTLFDTPGEALAITIYNGLAYVADNAAGIQVVNYVARDNKGVAPTISLVTSASGGVADAGRLLRLTADAVDDVQVRHIEFYVDGTEVFADGSFPFEHRFVPPAPT